MANRPVVDKFIDMRGREVGVCSKFDYLNAKEMAREDDDAPMSELQHRLKFIADTVEVDMLKID